jgi:hypothetical protein
VTGTYARQCVELAEEMQIPCVDTWTIMQQTEGWEKLFLRSLDSFLCVPDLYCGCIYFWYGRAQIYMWPALGIVMIL